MAKSTAAVGDGGAAGGDGGAAGGAGGASEAQAAAPIALPLPRVDHKTCARLRKPSQTKPTQARPKKKTRQTKQG